MKGIMKDYSKDFIYKLFASLIIIILQWLHIWDIYEECLLQTIKINFPFLGVLGKKVEFGAFCLHQGALNDQNVIFILAAFFIKFVL